jgi:hypothetical protein
MPRPIIALALLALAATAPAQAAPQPSRFAATGMASNLWQPPQPPKCPACGGLTRPGQPGGAAMLNPQPLPPRWVQPLRR